VTRTTLRPERTGRRFEQVVGGVIELAGGHVRRHAYAGRSCVGTPWHADAIVDNAREFPNGLIVECKWQEANGSNDEKFNFLVDNIRGAVLPAIVIIGGRGARRPGEGARAEAIAWLRRQVDGEHLIRVLTLEELISWIRDLHFNQVTLF